MATDDFFGGRSFRFEWLTTLALWHVDAVVGWGRPSHCLRPFELECDWLRDVFVQGFLNAAFP